MQRLELTSLAVRVMMTEPASLAEYIIGPSSRDGFLPGEDNLYFLWLSSY